MGERNRGVRVAISGPLAGVAGAGANRPGGGDPPTGGESRAKGSLGSCYYITQELGRGKVGEGERELFVCSWNARRGTVECPGRAK